MTPDVNHLIDPSVCSCFSNSYQYMICNKLKWSTVSISIALLIIIVYASSGLYTLIDVTTVMLMQSYNGRNETVPWPTEPSSMTIALGWISLSVYFVIVLLIIILLCGIQLGKPWLLFLWSIVMIVMLLADGSVTVLSFRQLQQQTYRSSNQVKILFSLMVIRLIISLSGIFIVIFHFRQLIKSKSEYVDRQRMLHRYNTESASPSYDTSWTHSGGLLNPSKDSTDDHYLPDLPLSTSLPRAKVATVQRHPTAVMFHPRVSLRPQSEYIDHPHQQPFGDYQENFRYSIPLKDRFHQQMITRAQEL